MYINITFSRLKIIDFKGIENFEIAFDNKTTNLIGENGTGKTTILDAIYWVFFGKNSLGKSKFDIQPIDSNNQVIPNKTPLVELQLMIDGEPVTLCKKLAKTCEYYYDEHEMKATEYAEKVSNIVSEKLFSVLINPVFFGDNYTWQEQKSLILDNFEVENTVIQEKKYAGIKKDITTYGYESTLNKYDKKFKEYDKTLIEKKSNKEYILKNLEGKSVDVSKDELSKKLETLRDMIKQLEDSKVNLISLERDLNDTNNSIAIAKNRFDNNLMNQKNDIQRDIRNKESDKDNLLKRYKEKNAQLKTISDTCVYCGNKIDKAVVEKQKSDINAELKKIIDDGNLLADQIKTLKIQLDNLNNEYIPAKELTEKKFQIEENIKKLKSNFDDETYGEIRAEITIVESLISGYDSIIKFQDDLNSVTNIINETTKLKEAAEIMIELVKKYNQEYSKLVADKLNSLLKNVKINTFNIQKNGEVKETFEITMYGVPYNSLNSAGKIIAGVELIQLINKALNINFPIVIDNKESITKIFDVENQLITLSVVEGAVLGV
jgi:exonuclease SbcC